MESANLRLWLSDFFLQGDSSRFRVQLTYESRKARDISLERGDLVQFVEEAENGHWWVPFGSCRKLLAVSHLVPARALHKLTSLFSGTLHFIVFRALLLSCVPSMNYNCNASALGTPVTCSIQYKTTFFAGYMRPSWNWDLSEVHESAGLVVHSCFKKHFDLIIMWICKSFLYITVSCLALKTSFKACIQLKLWSLLLSETDCSEDLRF